MTFLVRIVVLILLAVLGCVGLVETQIRAGLRWFERPSSPRTNSLSKGSEQAETPGATREEEES